MTNRGRAREARERIFLQRKLQQREGVGTRSMCSFSERSWGHDDRINRLNGWGDRLGLRPVPETEDAWCHGARRQSFSLNNAPIALQHTVMIASQAPHCKASVDLRLLQGQRCRCARVCRRTLLVQYIFWIDGQMESNPKVRLVYEP